MGSLPENSVIQLQNQQKSIEIPLEKYKTK